MFLLPWQTRLIWQQGEINGAPWEYGTYSIYATQILLWLIIILFGINRFVNRELWKKITTREHFISHRKYLFGAVGLIVLMIVAVLHSQDVWLSYNYVFNLLGALCVFVILSNIGVIPAQAGIQVLEQPLDPGSRSGMTIGMTMALWLG